MNKTYNVYMCRESLEDKLDRCVGRNIDDCYADDNFINIVDDLRCFGFEVIAMRNSLDFITRFIKQKAPYWGFQQVNR